MKKEKTCDTCKLYIKCQCMLDVSVCSDCYNYSQYIPKNKKMIIKE